MFALYVNHQRPARIELVKHGVTLRRRLPSMPTGILGVMCVDHLPVDLTEMTLIENAELLKRVRAESESLYDWLAATWPGATPRDAIARAVARNHTQRVHSLW